MESLTNQVDKTSWSQLRHNKIPLPLVLNTVLTKLPPGCKCVKVTDYLGKLTFHTLKNYQNNNDVQSNVNEKSCILFTKTRFPLASSSVYTWSVSFNQPLSRFTQNAKRIELPYGSVLGDYPIIDYSCVVSFGLFFK